jgi:RNA polymerase sigma factor for flagellar operon FliA
MSADLELFRVYRRTRTPELRERLVERHLPLVKYAAAWLAGRLPSHLRLDDLYSAGILGFLDALEHYDPDRGVPFSSYAAPRIRGAILDELRRADCVPRGVRRRLRNAQRAMEALAQELDREPTDEETAARLGMEIADYRRLLGENVTLVPLDNLPGDGEPGGAVSEALADPSLPSPLTALEQSEQRRRLGRLIDGLPERERMVLALYYHEELTMQDIGRVLGVTESRVSQIHSSAVLRLQGALRRQRPRAGDRGLAGADR